MFTNTSSKIEKEWEQEIRLTVTRFSKKLDKTIVTKNVPCRVGSKSKGGLKTAVDAKLAQYAADPSMYSDVILVGDPIEVEFTTL